MRSNERDAGLISSVLRGVLQLSAGTAIIRAFSASTQFVLAFWISPTGFGQWSAAVSTTALLAGLTNLGIVDGYLARRGISFRSLVRQRLIANALLATIGLLIASLYFGAGNPQVGILVGITALNIPLTGLAEIFHARRLRAGQYRSIVGSQALAAIAKLGVGIGVAAATASPLALAAGAITFSLGMIAFTARPIGDPGPDSTVETYRPRERISWATNALATKLPIYVGLFVAQFLTSAEVLGLFYLSYQGVLAISGIVAPPLKRVALSTLSRMATGIRDEVSYALAQIFSSATFAACALIATVLPAIYPHVSQSWRDAIPALAIFLSTLPSRMLSPVIDAHQQSGGQWWRSTRFHLFDGLTVALAALVALTDNIVLLAASLSGARILAMAVRTSIGLDVQRSK